MEVLGIAHAESFGEEEFMGHLIFSDGTASKDDDGADGGGEDGGEEGDEGAPLPGPEEAVYELQRDA